MMVSDQARNLREMARRNAACAASRGAGLPLVAVSGGKGGVGASSISLHLARALSRRGCRALLIEADLDRGGIVEAGDDGGSIADCLSGRRKLMEVCRTGPDGVRIVPGAWAPREMADCTALAQQRLLAELQSPMPQSDIVVIDLGSSRNAFVRRFWQAASMVVVVATAEAECVVDAYSAMKVLHAGDTSIPIYTLLNFTDRHCDPNAIHDRIRQTGRRFLGLRTSTLGSLPTFDDLTNDDADAAVGDLAVVLASELGLTTQSTNGSWDRNHWPSEAAAILFPGRGETGGGGES
jgi:flagellar biosynthesis protein FlhG